jgi:hypothetical protein
MTQGSNGEHPKYGDRQDQKPYGASVQRIFEKVLKLPLIKDTTISPEQQQFFPDDDITIYAPTKLFLEAARDAFESAPPALQPRMPPPQTIDLSGTIEFGENKTEPGRVHAALCFGGTTYSITVRSSKRKLPHKFNWNPDKFPDVKTDHGAWTDIGWGAVKEYLRFELKQTEHVGKTSSDFLSDLYSVAEMIFDAVLSEESKGIPSTGLLLITGGTGSGKTQVLNGILAKLLCERIRFPQQGRRPHVVTAGDPVESHFYQGNGKNGPLLKGVDDQCRSYADYRTNPIDYTARTVGTDVENIQTALHDALRETPSVYVVSELRNEEDFRAALNFAATGQLILATAHSTSVVDALQKLMVVSGFSSTASHRSLLAQRLKAVIHLQPLKAEGLKQLAVKKLQERLATTEAQNDQVIAERTGQELNALVKEKPPTITLPTVWQGNSSGIRNFVCDGLGSILPRDSDKNGAQPKDATSEGKGSLGYSWAVGKLKDRSRITWSNPVIDGDVLTSFVERMAHIKDIKA